jgi:hypothetical protein
VSGVVSANLAPGADTSPKRKRGFFVFRLRIGPSKNPRVRFGLVSPVPSRKREHGTPVCVAIVLVLYAASTALAAGPDVKTLFPAGGARGTTVEVAVNFNKPKWPVQAWVDRPGLTISAPNEKHNLAVVIAPEAAPGVYWVRLYDSEGAAAPLPFVVGTLSELTEAEGNDALSEAQAAGSSSVVVNGKLARRGDVDLFAVTLARGQTLVASLAARETLGSPMDAVLHIVGPAGGQLAYNHDQRGLDPEIVFQAPADGTYAARVFAFPSTPNSTIGFSGAIDHIYRLTLTTGPFVDYAWPLAVTRSRETRVELAGWNIPEALSSVVVRAEGERHEIADPRLANVAAVAVEPHETLVESEPNAPAAPQAIALPATVSGRIGAPGDVDAFAFPGKAGQALVLAVESRSLGYPLDGVLEVTDAAGKSLAKVDDAGALRDPVVTFTPPADGTFQVRVSDLNYEGSSRHVYRLRAVPAEPSYQVTADTHAYELVAEKPATEITLSIDRQHGFAEPIEIKAIGLPDFVQAPPVVSTPADESAKSVKLKLSTTGGAYSGAFRIEAQATGASKLARTATAAIPNHTARLSDLWLTVGAAKEASK